MQKNTAAPSPSTPTGGAEPSPLWATLEAYARDHILDLTRGNGHAV